MKRALSKYHYKPSVIKVRRSTCIQHATRIIRSSLLQWNLGNRNHRNPNFRTIIKHPKKIAAFGEEELTISENGIKIKLKNWPAVLKQLKEHADYFLEDEEYFNCAIVKRYENGKNYKPKHNKEEDPNIDENSSQVIRSFGENRIIHFIKEETKEYTVTIGHGSMLIVDLPTWQHDISEMENVTETIIITFKKLKKCP
ncbi:hypothetical protein AVEN_23368-1 [Araneus ventricosus]|uniref:Uncharacterized protein n=1 Tax=Araneus ventricosus TaxID=182803 RepID=A0A4Y2EV16_ARAVE|nr:hypothetical protein AVEN_23368-1 [Araneus ventricosus]